MGTGANEPTTIRLRSKVAEFLRAPVKPLVVILLVAGTASAFLGEVTDAAIIGGIVLMSAGITGDMLHALGGAMKLKVVLERAEEGGYTIQVPSLPGCISEGETVDEALANIREAIELYLEPVEDDLAGKEGTEVRELIV